MLRSLAEDIKNNALFKKAPEVYNEVLNNQLKGTELETINIDTEYVLNQQGGYELLKSAAKAAGIEPVTLGKRILRTETAGLTVMAWIMYQLEEE